MRTGVRLFQRVAGRGYVRRHYVQYGTVSFYTPGDGGGLPFLLGSTVEVNNDGPGKEQMLVRNARARSRVVHQGP